MSPSQWLVGLMTFFAVASSHVGLSAGTYLLDSAAKGGQAPITQKSSKKKGTIANSQPSAKRSVHRSKAKPPPTEVALPEGEILEFEWRPDSQNGSMDGGPSIAKLNTAQAWKRLLPTLVYPTMQQNEKGPLTPGQQIEGCQCSPNSLEWKRIRVISFSSLYSYLCSIWQRPNSLHPLQPLQLCKFHTARAHSGLHH